MPGDNLIQSVLRSLTLLECVAGSENGLTLQEMARALGVPPPTAHNLARTLLSRGYLEKVSHPVRYRLGAAVFELVQARGRRELARRAGEMLPQLAAAFPAATLTFTEIVGGEVLPALRMSPERPGFLQQGYGQPMGAYTSASALLFQAFATDLEREDYRRRYPFAEYGAHR